MSYSPEHLLYLRKRESLRDKLGDWLDRSIDYLFVHGLTKTVRIDGEENIPRNQPVFVVFAPHTGVAEVFAINYVLEQTNLATMWMTKKETFDLVPNFFLERRYYPVARHEYDKRALVISTQILRNQGITGTALEGTRGGEKLDLKKRIDLTINERRELYRAQPGPVYVAWKTNVPILPVAIWGPEDERLFPFPEKFISEAGKLGLAISVLKTILFEPKANKPEIHIRFAPIYQDHLSDPNLAKNRNRSKTLQEHADRIMVERIIPLLPEGWSKGIYA